MRVHCPRCKRPLGGDEIDLAAGRALCRPCGELFSLPELSNTAHVATHRPEELRLDESIEQGVRARFALRPSGRERYVTLGASLGTVALIVAILMAPANPAKKPAPLFDLMCLLWFVGFALIFGFLALLAFVNTLHVTLEGGELVVESRPIRLRRFRLAIDEIDGFDFTEKSKATRGPPPAAARVLLKDGRARKLRIQLPKPHVEYLVARLNAALAAVRMPTGYRDGGVARLRAPPPSPTPPPASSPEDAAPPAESRRGTLSR